MTVATAVTRHLGIDLGGTNVKLVVLEREDGGVPRAVAAAVAPTSADAGPEAVARRMVEAGCEIAATHGPIATAGIGVPGLFDAASGRIVLFPNLPGSWPGFPLRDRMAEGLGLPVRIVNDARAFVLAEAAMGAGRGHRTIVGLTLGTGIGGGLIVDGRLVMGSTGTAGEVGHQTIDPDGPLCGCGNRGCAEVLAQAGTIARTGGRATAEAVFEAAAASDPRAVAAVEGAARALGIAIANVVTLLVPDAVVLGGGMAEAGEVLLDPIRRVVREHTPLLPDEAVRIVTAELGPQAGAIGAALAGAGIGVDAVG
jgi:glucokinase